MTQLPTLVEVQFLACLELVDLGDLVDFRDPMDLMEPNIF